MTMKMKMMMMMMMMIGLVKGAATPSQDPSNPPGPISADLTTTTYYNTDNELDFPDLKIPNLKKILHRLELDLRHNSDLRYDHDPTHHPEETYDDPEEIFGDDPDPTLTLDPDATPPKEHETETETETETEAETETETETETERHGTTRNGVAKEPNIEGVMEAGDGMGSSEGPATTRVPGRQKRHFSTVDVCGEAVCEQMVRQATGLARVKMVRRYIMDTVAALDSLVTALDAELVVAGETMGRSLGNRCRSAHALLAHVTKGPFDSDRLNAKSSRFVYGTTLTDG